MHNIKADRGLQQQANAKWHRDLEKEARKKKVQPLTPDDWQAAERVYQQGEITPRRGAINSAFAEWLARGTSKGGRAAVRDPGGRDNSLWWHHPAVRRAQGSTSSLGASPRQSAMQRHNSSPVPQFARGSCSTTASDFDLATTLRQRDHQRSRPAKGPGLCNPRFKHAYDDPTQLNHPTGSVVGAMPPWYHPDVSIGHQTSPRSWAAAQPVAAHITESSVPGWTGATPGWESSAIAGSRWSQNLVRPHSARPALRDHDEHVSHGEAANPPYWWHTHMNTMTPYTPGLATARSRETKHGPQRKADRAFYAELRHGGNRATSHHRAGAIVRM